MKNNKILIIILTIVLVLSVGVGSYFIFDSIYIREPDTNDDLNNQTGNNNVNAEKTSLEILNDLVRRGIVKETNFNESPHSNKDYAYYINNKGQIVIKYGLDDENFKEVVCDEIEGKVSKVGSIIFGGALSGFFVITEDGKLYITAYVIGDYRQGEYNPYVNLFEEIKLPSPIAKIYDAGNNISFSHYVLLKNNDVYELNLGISSDDKNLKDKLSEISFIKSITVHSYSVDPYPCIHIAYNGKVFFDNYDSVYEIKDENNNSFSANYVIANGIKDKQQDNYQYFNAFIVDKNNEIYIISKITQNYDENGVIKINTKPKKYSSKKVKTVSNDSDDNQVIVTYVDGSKEKLDGYYISMNK